MCATNQKLKLISAVCSLLLFISTSTISQDYVHPSTTDPGYMNETSYFMFYNHYWLNMHHFLYNQAKALKKAGETAHFSQPEWEKTSQQDRETVSKVLTYYIDQIIDLDLRTGDYTYSFKRWVITTQNELPLKDKELFQPQIDLLNEVSPIYRKYFWDKHRLSNEAALQQNLALIKKHEEAFVDTLEVLCMARWQKEKIRIDISYNSKRDIPYTTVRPAAHIVMDSKRSTKVAGDWFEAILHEASHHLISSRYGFVSGTIKNVCNKQGVKTPRQLWHGYLFYLSGVVAKDLLKQEGMDYQLYMVRENVFASYYPAIHKTLPKYMSNQLTLSEATEIIIKDLSENK